MSKTALVTGASAGLGEAFAEELARQGYDLYIVARRKDRLDSLASRLRQEFDISVIPLQCDLTKQDDRERLFDATGGERSEIDLVINNAGFGKVGNFHQHSKEIVRSMIDLNVMAVADLAHMYLPRMVQREKGAMVIVSSIASFQPLPYFALYAATKSFDRILGESLYEELKPHGVHVLTLCPGPTRTEFYLVSGVDSSLSFKSMDASDVIQQTMRALAKKNWETIPGWKNKFLTAGQSLLPRFLVNKISGWLMHRVAKK